MEVSRRCECVLSSRGFAGRFGSDFGRRGILAREQFAGSGSMGKDCFLGSARHGKPARRTLGGWQREGEGLFLVRRGIEVPGSRDSGDGRLSQAVSFRRSQGRVGGGFRRCRVVGGRPSVWGLPSLADGPACG